ncbi:transmembrane domain-containing protein [Cryptosporidium canis]|uniref:Transmembrane domain-containing protein n=1 Tax=Cryptosporidium canis TaxID=195482 RepID=A0ABQ8P2B9_9CRYT|nr:transmembrane domain-containing protein [Cryptosporidium canis]
MRGVSLVQSSPDGGLPLARIYRTNVGEYVQEGWRVGLLLIIVGASPGVAIIGLFRSQIRQGEDLSYRESFLSHYVHSNLGFVIGGVSSSLGFALIENIAYLSNSTENILLMILIGIARTFLSVPFHISASGYSCIILSRYIFREDDLHGSRAPESTSTFMSDVLSSDLLKKTLASGHSSTAGARRRHRDEPGTGAKTDSRMALLKFKQTSSSVSTSFWSEKAYNKLEKTWVSPEPALCMHGAGITRHDGYRFLNGFGGFVVAVYQFVCSRLAGPGEAHLQQEGPGGWGRAGGRGSWRGGRAR